VAILRDACLRLGEDTLLLRKWEPANKLRPHGEEPCEAEASQGVSNHGQELLSLRPSFETPVFAKAKTGSSDRMSLPVLRRLTLDASARVARIGRAEPHARKVSHG